MIEKLDTAEVHYMRINGKLYRFTRVHWESDDVVLVWAEKWDPEVYEWETVHDVQEWV